MPFVEVLSEEIHMHKNINPYAQGHKHYKKYILYFDILKYIDINFLDDIIICIEQY